MPIYSNRTVYLFELDGYTWYIRGGARGADSALTEHQAKRPYRRIVTPRPAGEEYATIEGDNYPAFPIVPLYPNHSRQSELTEPILSKIRSINLNETLYMDEVFREPFMRYLIQGMGGDVKELAELKKVIQRSAIVPLRRAGDDGSIEAVPTEIPWQSHKEAMERLEDAIYRDAQVTNVRAMSGGSLTNVVIKAHMVEEDTKMVAVEQEAKEFVRKLLFVAGVSVSANDIKFSHSTVVNESEIHSDIANLTNAGVITPEIGAKVAPILIQANMVDKAVLAIGKRQLALDEASVAEYERQLAEVQADDPPR